MKICFDRIKLIALWVSLILFSSFVFCQEYDAQNPSPKQQNEQQEEPSNTKDDVYEPTQDIPSSGNTPVSKHETVSEQEYIRSDISKLQTALDGNNRGMIIALSCSCGVLFLGLIALFVIIFCLKKQTDKKLSEMSSNTENSQKKLSDLKTQMDALTEIASDIPTADRIKNVLMEQALKTQFSIINSKLQDISNRDISSQFKQMLTQQSMILDSKLKMIADTRNDREIIDQIGKLHTKFVNELQPLQRQKIETERKCLEAEQKIKTVDSEIKKNGIELQSQLAAAQNEIANKERQILSLKQNASDAEKTGFENGLKKSQNEILSLNLENASLKQKLTALEQNMNSQACNFKEKIDVAVQTKEIELRNSFAKEKQLLQGRLDKKSEECLALRQSLNDSESKGYNKGLQESQETVSLLSEAKGALEQKLEYAVQQKKSLEENHRNQLADLDNENKNLHEQSVGYKTKIQTLEHDLQEESKKVSDKQIELASALEKVKKLSTDNDAYKSRVGQLTQEKKALADSLRTEQEKVAEFIKILYPAEFLEDSDFAVLKEHIETWTAEKLDGVHIVKSALELFSQRAFLRTETWQNALQNISFGISLTLKDLSSSALLSELVLWSNFLMKYSDENFDFSLKLPKPGDDIDSTWMSTNNSRNTKVNNVLSWAVYDNQFGLRYNAEVE